MSSSSTCPHCSFPYLSLVRGKLQCSFCGLIIEGCCEGTACIPERRPMTADEYQKATARTEAMPNNRAMSMLTAQLNPYAEWQLRLIHHSLGAASESGELADQLKRYLFYGKPLDEINLMEECGDVLWYISRMLDVMGFTMSECMERNIAKLKARYPEKFTEEAAANRDLEKERQTLEPSRDSSSAVSITNRKLCTCGGVIPEGGSMCAACWEEYTSKMSRTRPQG